LRLENGIICGGNTDVIGFTSAVRALIGAPNGARVLIVGAGGAARAAVYALLQERAASIVVLNRSPDKAEELCATFKSDRVRTGDASVLQLEPFDLVVNATSLGLDPADVLPISLESVRRVGAVLDM